MGTFWILAIIEYIFVNLMFTYALLFKLAVCGWLVNDAYSLYIYIWSIILCQQSNKFQWIMYTLYYKGNISISTSS
jgi:hypothetical protein